MSNEPIKVFVADDHPAIIESLKMRLQKDSDLKYVGSATDSEALKKEINNRIDVLLLDVFSDEDDFLDLIRDMKAHYSELKILVLSGKENLHLAQKTIECGARGYLSKGLNMEDIIHSIKLIVKYANRKIINLIDPDIEESDREEVKKLITRRELQVIALLCKGFPNNEEIAEFISKINGKKIAPSTVQVHRREIRRKLKDYGVTNDASLGYWVSQWELLDGSELSSNTDEE